MKILFQGDSVTDAGRTENSLGFGYPSIIAKELPEIYPDIEFQFYNRGVSGNRSIDLVNRWQTDTLDISPDILTILIGVNDCWHYAEGTAEYVTNEEFENNLRKLITDAKSKSNPKIILIEPYVFEYQHNHFRGDLLEKIEVIRKVSMELADYLIPLDGLIFAARTAEKNVEFSSDGVHPSPEGHELIAMYIMDAICDIIDSQNNEK